MSKVEEYNENYSAGWIKSYRSKFKHWIADRPDYFYAWDWLLHHVNVKDKKALIGSELYPVKRGQIITSINNLSKSFKMSHQSTRTFLSLLEADEMIVKKSTSKLTYLTICKYGVYQDVQQTNNTLATNQQQTNNKPATTTKEVKEDKNVKKLINNIGFDLFWNLYDYKKGDKEKIKTKWNKLDLKTKEKIISYLPAYKLSTPDKKYRKHPMTFLNNKGWEDEILITKTERHDTDY